MFDTYKTYKAYGPNKIQIDIVQKKETTEETLRLYHELLEKARAEVLESLHCKNEVVDFHALRINTGLQTKIMIAFKLNGEQYVTEAPITHAETLMAINKMELIRFTVQRMADAIADKLLHRIDSL